MHVFQAKHRYKYNCVQHDYRNKRNQKYLKNMYHANVTVNLMVESVIQIKSGIIIYVTVSANL